MLFLIRWDELLLFFKPIFGEFFLSGWVGVVSCVLSSIDHVLMATISMELHVKYSTLKTIHTDWNRKFPSMFVITARKRSCGNVMFAHACVILSMVPETPSQTETPGTENRPPIRTETPQDREIPWTETPLLIYVFGFPLCTWKERVLSLFFVAVFSWIVTLHASLHTIPNQPC